MYYSYNIFFTICIFYSWCICSGVTNTGYGRHITDVVKPKLLPQIIFEKTLRPLDRYQHSGRKRGIQYNLDRKLPTLQGSRSDGSLK